MRNLQRVARNGVRSSLGLLIATTVLLAAFGCSDDKKNPASPGGGGGGGGGGSTSFTGLLVSGTLSATVSVTINSTSLVRGIHAAPASVVTASGSLKVVGGGTSTLAGSYDPDADTLYLAGGGYTLRGDYDTSGSTPGILGSWTGPASGSGSWGCVPGGTSTVKTYSGSYQSSNSSDHGTWNFIVYADTALVGIAVPSDNSSELSLEGTVERTPSSPDLKHIELMGHDDNTGADLTASGGLTVSTNHVAGDWALTLGLTPVDNGTWGGDIVP